MADAHWIASSRMSVLGPGTRRRTWPRRLIEAGESVTRVSVSLHRSQVGGAALQTSTLCFPTELAREVRWDTHAGAPHDEPSWLIRVQRTIPDVRVVQLPDVLSTYNVQDSSVSRDTSDRTDEYIEWGLQYLATESPRVLGDYLCTSPVSAAVSARSLSGVRRSLRSALRHGRPGPFALAYAVLNAARIVVRSAETGNSADDRGSGSTCTRGASRAALRSRLPRSSARPSSPRWASRTPLSSCAKPGRRYSGWCPWSRRSRCCSPSLTSASVPRC